MRTGATKTRSRLVTALAILLITLASPAAAHAQEEPLPDEDPIPDSWWYCNPDTNEFVTLLASANDVSMHSGWS